MWKTILIAYAELILNCIVCLYLTYSKNKFRGVGIYLALKYLEKVPKAQFRKGMDKVSHYVFGLIKLNLNCRKRRPNKI